jgi:radical SAM superfamily enzyme with C-terminal helix-hairpin-helix motif
MRCVILDGYVDEPTCLGVPPYISPYPRYVAGAMVDAGIPVSKIHYYTIDQLRCDPRVVELLERADLIVAIAGTTVPGRYLAAHPITLRELKDLLSQYAGKIIAGGAIRFGYSSQGGSAAVKIMDEGIAERDLEAAVFDFIKRRDAGERWRTIEEVARWSVKGAFIIRQHPCFPRVMCEIETYRGCLRDCHCSFCTEPFYEREFRNIEDVVGEVASLYDAGARYFRVGRQPDLLTYQGSETPEGFKPNPSAIERLYRGIRKVAGDLKVLHMDNVNPATLAEFPEESRETLKAILRYHTSGDVAALGVESADPKVIERNNLKVHPEDVVKAVKLINEVGAGRGKCGLPELLPGVNFVYGLAGERRETYRLNFELLKSIYEQGLLLRRVNLRQVMVFPHTPLSKHKVQVNHKLFAYYKEKIQREIDQPMLRRVVPKGAVLKDVFLEVHEGEVTLGRQLASYPLLVGIPQKLPLGKSVDVMITRHSYRSVAGVPIPLNVNTAPLRLLSEALGRKTAARIAARRPIEDLREIKGLIGNFDWLCM